MRSLKIIIFWFPVLFYSGIIFWVSSWPEVHAPLPELASDKFLHVLEYIPFGYLLARAIMKSSTGPIRRKTVVVITALCSLLYGISDEFHQSFVPGRDSNVIDVLADALGGMIGGFLYPLQDKIRKRS